MVRRRSGRFPFLGPRYRRVRRGGIATVSPRMSETSWRSSAADSSAKSRLRSRSVADAARRRARPSGSSSSLVSDDSTASAISVREIESSASAEDDPRDGLSPSARWNPAWAGSTCATDGAPPPKIAAKTWSKAGIWLGSDTTVARAQARNSATDEAFMTVMARASRSQRSGPTGKPAVCRATPSAAAVAATSGATGASVNGGDHRSQPGLAYRFLVLGVLHHRAQRLVGHRHGQFLLAEHADGEGPGNGLGDTGR